jgi:hypothetical protein
MLAGLLPRAAIVGTCGFCESPQKGSSDAHAARASISVWCAS